jgi:hypothetical protein
MWWHGLKLRSIGLSGVSLEENRHDRFRVHSYLPECSRLSFESSYQSFDPPQKQTDLSWFCTFVTAASGRAKSARRECAAACLRPSQSANAGCAGVTTNHKSPFVSMAAPLPILVSDPSGCLTLSKARAHCGIQSTSKNTGNEIIRYLRSWL